MGVGKGRAGEEGPSAWASAEPCAEREGPLRQKRSAPEALHVINVFSRGVLTLRAGGYVLLIPIWCPMKTPLSVVVHPKRVLYILAGVVGVLLVFSLFGQFSRFILEHGRLLGFVEEFNVDLENNIPTYFSGVLLLGAGALCGLVAWTRQQWDRPFGRHWAVLGFLLAYVSVDEVAEIHERTISPLRDLLGADGLLYYAWVVPAMGILLVLAVVYARFFWHLPRRWKGWFTLAAGTYLSGALGVEVLGGLYASQYGVNTFSYALITTVEEGLEMMGTVLFLYALLAFLRADGLALHVTLAGQGERVEQPTDAAS